MHTYIHTYIHTGGSPERLSSAESEHYEGSGTQSHRHHHGHEDFDAIDEGEAGWEAGLSEEEIAKEVDRRVVRFAKGQSGFNQAVGATRV